MYNLKSKISWHCPSKETLFITFLYFIRLFVFWLYFMFRSWFQIGKETVRSSKVCLSPDGKHENDFLNFRDEHRLCKKNSRCYIFCVNYRENHVPLPVVGGINFSENIINVFLRNFPLKFTIFFPFSYLCASEICENYENKIFLFNSTPCPLFGHPK